VRAAAAHALPARNLTCHRSLCAALRAIPAASVEPGLRDAGRAISRFGTAQDSHAPGPHAVLADVVTTALFALVEAFPGCADLLAPADKEQRAALAWFKDK
jgi:hypothetical protein